MGLMSSEKNIQLDFNVNFDKLFDIFLNVGCSIGKIKLQSKVSGHIIIGCPMKFLKMINPATLDISLIKKDENLTSVNIISQSNYDGTIGLSSASRWQKIFLEEVDKRV